MADELILYTNPMSRGRIARWMLEEVGAPYRAEILDYASTMKQDPYLAINPMGKVPALVHGATVITECAAICAYLADAFPEAGLAPPPGARGAYYRWLFFAAGPVEQAVTNHALKFDPTAEQGRLAAMATTIWRCMCWSRRSPPTPMSPGTASLPPTSMSARR